MFKIKDNSNTQVCDPKIVQHQSTFVISNSVNHLCIHDNRIKCDQVGNEESNLGPFVEDIERRLLPKRNLSQIKLDHQCIFVWLFNQPVTKRVKNLDGASNNLKGPWPTTFRCSCPFVFISG